MNTLDLQCNFMLDYTEISSVELTGTYFYVDTPKIAL